MNVILYKYFQHVKSAGEVIQLEIIWFRSEGNRKDIQSFFFPENLYHLDWSFQRSHYIWATSWENLFLQFVNNKGADQPAHPRGLISTFVVRCLDSIIPLLPISEISGRFESTLVANPEDRFSHDVAHMILRILVYYGFCISNNALQNGPF